MAKKNNKNLPPVGRTFYTNDKFLPHNNKNAYKNVDVVNIETNKNGEMIVVRLSKQKTKNTSPLKHHTYKGFKHFVEIEDIDKQPIKRGERFKQNSSDYDLIYKQVYFISDIVYNHSKQSQRNQKNRDKFRNRYRNKKTGSKPTCLNWFFQWVYEIISYRIVL